MLRGTKSHEASPKDTVEALLESANRLTGGGVPLPDARYSEHHVRAKVIAEALTHLGSEGVVEAVLETRAGTNKDFQPLDNKDHQVLRKLQRQGAVPDSFRIRHDDKTEAILQIADLLAGARSDGLCGVNRETYYRISHRVRATRTVFSKRP